MIALVAKLEKLLWIAKLLVKLVVTLVAWMKCLRVVEVVVV